MSGLKLTVDEQTGRIEHMAIWLPRIAVAVAFLSIGADKLSTASSWTKIFAQIGLGQWFRYFTGALQVTGAALVLLPRTCLIGVAILGTTMLGAVMIWIFWLHKAGNAMFPAAILIALIVVGLQAQGSRSRHQTL